MANTHTPVAAPRQQFINLDLVRRIVLCHGLNGTSRSVLLTVGMHASQDRQQCFCSIATLSHKSGWSRRTIIQHLTRLQQLGYLSLIGIHDSGTSIYQIRLERLPTDAGAAPRHNRSHHRHYSPDAAAPQAAHSAYPADADPASAGAACPVAPAPAPAYDAAMAPAPTSPVPTPAPPPPAEPPATPCADGAHPPGTNCAPPTQNMPAPHAPAAHKEEVEQGFEQPKKEEAATSAKTPTAPGAMTAVAQAAASLRPVIVLNSSLPTGQIDANTIGLLNAQRQRNGKDPLAHRDILHMGTQAAKAGLTPLAAAQWVLASPKRNFFKADFYAPPLVQPAVLHSAAAPSGHTPPRPTPLTPEQQAEQDRAREAGLAHIRQCLAKMPPVDHQRTATARPSTAANTRWATNAIEQFMAGHPISRYRLHSACEVLGIHPRSLQRQVA
ncbi:MAG: helix-turn-helix domain-containing protein [Macromonas sp.]